MANGQEVIATTEELLSRPVMKTTEEIDWLSSEKQKPDALFGETISQDPTIKTTEELNAILPVHKPIELEPKPGLGYIAGETIKGVGSDVLKIAKNLVTAPVQVFQGLKKAKETIDNPEWQKRFLDRPAEEIHREVSETLAGFAKTVPETAKGLITFFPETGVRLIKDPHKQIVEDPLGTLFLLGAVGGLAFKGIQAKAELGKYIEAKDISAAVQEGVSRLVPDFKVDPTLINEEVVGRYNAKLREMLPTSGRPPEQVETWAEMPRTPKEQPLVGPVATPIPQEPPIIGAREPAKRVITPEGTVLPAPTTKKGVIAGFREAEKPTTMPVVDVTPNPEGGWTIKFDLPKAPERVVERPKPSVEEAKVPPETAPGAPGRAFEPLATKPVPRPEIEITPEMIAEQKALRRQAAEELIAERARPKKVSEPLPLYERRPTMFGKATHPDLTYEMAQPLPKEWLRIKEVIPERKVSYGRKPTEAEYYERKGRILETESKILEATGRPEKEIGQFVANTFIDGNELRKITEQVLDGIMPLEKAVEEVRTLVDTTIRPETLPAGELPTEEPIVPEVPATPGKAVPPELQGIFERRAIEPELRGRIIDEVLTNFDPAKGESLENYVMGQYRYIKRQGEVRPKEAEVSLGEIEPREKGATPETRFEAKELEGQVRDIILRQAKDDIDKDILVRRFFDYESLESLGRRHSISKQAVQKRVDEAFRKLSKEPDAMTVREYLKQKKYIELNFGIPLTTEIAKAVNAIRARIKERRVIKLNEIKEELAKTEKPDAVKKVLLALKEAKPLRKEQEALYTAERGKRIAKSMAVGKEVRGEKGFQAEKAQLAGELPKVEYESIREKVTQVDIDELFNRIKDSPLLTEWEKFPAREGLAKIFGEVGGKVPTEGELQLLNRVFGPEFTKTIMSKMDTWSKIKQTLYQVANVPRSLMASFDLSAPFRQGIFFIGKPKQFFGSFSRMFGYFGSEKAFKGLFDEIAQRPTYELMRESRLALTEMDAILGLREERFMSQMAEKIPVIGKVVRASGRAYTGFLDKLRADIFDDLVAKAEGLGLKPRDNSYLSKQIAEFVNAGTGRGDLGSLRSAGPALNAVFFSPRLMASRLKLLNPKMYIAGDPFVRKQALKSLLSFAGAGFTILTLSKLGGLEVSTDPRSSDFGKIKIGNTRIDIWGGFQQYIRTAYQLIKGETVASTTGKITKVGEGYKPLTRLGILARFVETKEAPVLSFTLDLARGQTSYGEKLDVPKEVKDRFVPMVIQDTIEIAKDDPSLLPLSTLGVFGMGLQTYSQGEYYELLNKYFEKKKAGVKDEEAFKAIQEFIRKQPAEERHKFATEFKDYGVTYALPDRGWWLGLQDTQNSESRVNMFWAKYIKGTDAEKGEMIRQAKQVPRVWSPQFASKLYALIEKNQQGLNQND